MFKRARKPSHSELDAAARREANALVLPTIRRIAIQRCRDGAEVALIQAALELTGAARVYVHWLPIPLQSATAFAAESGEVLSLERISDHPLYCSVFDDPHGWGSEPALLAPIIHDGRVIAVVSVIGRSRATPFTRSDRAVLNCLAMHSAALLVRFIGRPPRFAAGTEVFETEPQLGQRPPRTDTSASRWIYFALIAVSWLAVAVAFAQIGG